MQGVDLIGFLELANSIAPLISVAGSCLEREKALAYEGEGCTAKLNINSEIIRSSNR